MSMFVCAWEELPREEVYTIVELDSIAVHLRVFDTCSHPLHVHVHVRVCSGRAAS